MGKVRPAAIGSRVVAGVVLDAAEGETIRR
jgi:hypothetical protein